MFSGGTYTANRRFLLGNRNPPFLLKPLTQYEDGFTFYSQIENHPEISVKVVNGSTIVITRPHDRSSKKSNNLIQCRIEHDKNISLLIPIVETEWFIIVDQTNHIFFFNLSGTLFPVGNLVVFNLWSISYFVYNNFIYLLVGDDNHNINIIQFAIKYPKIRCEGKNSINPGMMLTGCTGFFVEDDFYLVATDLKDVFYMKYDIKANNGTTEQFTNMTKLFNIPKSASNFLGPQYVTTNNDYIVFTNFDFLIILKINDFVAAINDKSKKWCTYVGVSEIARSLNIKNSPSIVTTVLPPFILTHNHVVFCSLSSPSKGREGRLLNVDSDYIAAYSLSTGKLATQFPLSDMNIFGLIHGPGTDKFTVCTYQGALYADISKEHSPTEVPLYSQELSSLTPNHSVLKSDILLRLLRKDKYSKAEELIKKIMEKDNIKPAERASLAVLTNEVMLLKLRGQSDVEKVERFSDPVSESKFQIDKNIDYIVQMRAFSPMVSLYHDELSLDKFSDLNEFSKIRDFKKHLLSIALRTPQAIIDKLSSLTFKEQINYLVPIAPFIGGGLDIKVLLRMLQAALRSGQNEYAALLIYLISQEAAASEYDGYVENILKKNNPCFPNILTVTDSFTRAEMPLCVSYMKNVPKRSSEEVKVSSTNKDVIIQHRTRKNVEEQLHNIYETLNKQQERTNANAYLIEAPMIRKPMLSVIPQYCSICKGALKKCDVVFNCGHGFHEKCLESVMEDIIDDQELFELNSMKGRALTPEESERRDEILLQDCPCCGEISINLLSKPLYDPLDDSRFPPF